jgi:aldehyde dehydrogenase (NAD+)
MAVQVNPAATVALLRKGFNTQKTRSLDFRRGQLNALLRLVEENTPRLNEALKKDLNKCDTEASLAETQTLKADIKQAIASLSSWTAPQPVSTPLVQMKGLTSSYIQCVPLGVVLVIGAWNYPIALTLGPLLGALAAGNCVLVKPSELSEHSSRILAELIPRYLDPEVVQVIQGGAAETTLILKEKFDHIIYTGSSAVGRIIARAAAEHLTPTTLELGGKSPCFVDKDAHVQMTANRIISGKILNSGQSCIAPDYLLVHHSIVEPLIAAMRQSLLNMLGPDPKASPDYGRIINNRHYKRIVAMLEGADIILGGERDEATRYIAPTLIRCSLDGKHKAMQEEIFGPILPIIPVASMQVGIDYVNANPHPLALYVFSSNRDVVRQVLDQTTSGGVCVNDTLMHYLNPALPFGGVGESGHGAYHGRFSFELFSHKRAVMDKSIYGDLPLRYPPWTENKVWALKHLL